MKNRLFALLALTFLSTLNPQFSTCFAQSTAFTYNGRLDFNGALVTGPYEMEFTLFDADIGIGVVKTLPVIPVDVVNGLFTTRLDFGADVFTGPARWLEIKVRPVGAADYVILTPRQEVTSSPYSIRAQTAGSVANSSVAANQLNTGGVAPTPGQFLSYNGGNLFWSDPGVAAGNIWSLAGGNAFYNAGNVGIGTNMPAHRLSIAGGPNWTANLWKGALDLQYGAAMAFRGNAGTNYGIGSASGGLYFFHSASDPGTTASPTLFDMELADSGHLLIGGPSSDRAGIPLQVNGNLLLTPGGSGGEVQFGIPNGETGMSIIGANRADVRFDGSTLKLLAGVGPGAMPPDNGITVDTSGNVGVGQSMFFGSQPRQMFNLFGTGFGIGIQTADLYFRSGAGFAWHVGGVHNDATYNAGAGGTTLMTLDVQGLKFGDNRFGQHLWLWSDPATTRYFGIGIQDSTLYNRCGGGGADGFVWYKGGIHNDGYHNGGGGQLLMTLDSNGMFVGGPASVCTLTIRGGCDLAEPFPMKEEEIERGSVVVIDDEHPGQLKLSTEAYDTRVAGIISGANGVNAGIALHQEGVLEGGQNVALSGRVYVQADATFGAIKPGDMLTTSETPGHAMKVSDHGKAQGAILGKAMSPLEAGKGLVLVLVTLQ